MAKIHEVVGLLTTLTLIGKAGFTGLISANHFSSASRSANTRSARLGVSLQSLSTNAGGAQESDFSLMGCFQGPDVSLCAVLPWSTERELSSSLQSLSYRRLRIQVYTWYRSCQITCFQTSFVQIACGFGLVHGQP